MAAAATATASPSSVDDELDDILESFPDSEPLPATEVAIRIIQLWKNDPSVVLTAESNAVAMLLSPSTREAVTRDSVRSWLSFFCLCADGSVSLGAGVRASVQLAQDVRLAFQADPGAALLDLLVTKGIGGEPEGFASPDEQRECKQDAVVYALTWSSPIGPLSRRLVFHARGLPGGHVDLVPAALLASDSEAGPLGGPGPDDGRVAKLRRQARAVLAMGPGATGADEGPGEGSAAFMAVLPSGEATVCGHLVDVVHSLAAESSAVPLWPCLRPCQAADACFLTYDEARCRGRPAVEGEGYLRPASDGSGLTLEVIPPSGSGWDFERIRIFAFPASRGTRAVVGEPAAQHPAPAPGDEARVFVRSEAPLYVAPGAKTFPTLALLLESLCRDRVVDRVRLPDGDYLSLSENHHAALTPVDRSRPAYDRSDGSKLPAPVPLSEGGAQPVPADEGGTA